jgi:hypothetical protein
MKIHWHFDNPWRDKAIYVPVENVAPLSFRRYVDDFGPKLDAYILVQPDGRHEAGIRFGDKPDQYLSISTIMCVDLVALADEWRLQWRPCRWRDELTRPTQPGSYILRITGDSETEGPHVYYDYPDYTTFGNVHIEEGEVIAGGIHDEDADSIIAWYGPLALPECDCF